MPHQPKGGNGVSGRIRFITARVRKEKQVLSALFVDMSMQMS